jgi:alkylated DNA repair dioxygenase AlkB
LLTVVANARRQADFFSSEQAMPEGFVYREKVLSAEEERHFVEHLAMLPFAAFEFHGFLGRRRIVSFGWRYDYAGRQIRPSAQLPEFLLPLRERAAEVAGLSAESLHQVLVTEYAPGAPIGWHRDKPMFQDVVAISFFAPLRSPLPSAAARRLGTALARRDAAIGIPPPRRRPDRMGAQHSATQRPALFGDVPQSARLMTSSTSAASGVAGVVASIGRDDDDSRKRLSAASRRGRHASQAVRFARSIHISHTSSACSILSSRYLFSQDLTG